MKQILCLQWALVLLAGGVGHLCEGSADLKFGEHLAKLFKGGTDFTNTFQKFGGKVTSDLNKFDFDLTNLDLGKLFGGKIEKKKDKDCIPNRVNGTVEILDLSVQDECDSGSRAATIAPGNIVGPFRISMEPEGFRFEGSPAQGMVPEGVITVPCELVESKSSGKIGVFQCEAFPSGTFPVEADEALLVLCFTPSNEESPQLLSVTIEETDPKNGNCDSAEADACIIEETRGLPISVLDCRQPEESCDCTNSERTFQLSFNPGTPAATPFDLQVTWDIEAVLIAQPSLDESVMPNPELVHGSSPSPCAITEVPTPRQVLLTCPPGAGTAPIDLCLTLTQTTDPIITDPFAVVNYFAKLEETLQESGFCSMKGFALCPSERIRLTPETYQIELTVPTNANPDVCTVTDLPFGVNVRVTRSSPALSSFFQFVLRRSFALGEWGFLPNAAGMDPNCTLERASVSDLVFTCDGTPGTQTEWNFCFAPAPDTIVPGTYALDVDLEELGPREDLCDSFTLESPLEVELTVVSGTSV